MRIAIAAVFMLMAVSSPACAADTKLADILGRWCLPNGNTNTFTSGALTVVFPDGRQRVLQIERTSQDPNGDLNVLWAERQADGSTYNTAYRLSADKRVLIQVANTSGDMGPERQMRRC